MYEFVGERGGGREGGGREREREAKRILKTFGFTITGPQAKKYTFMYIIALKLEFLLVRPIANKKYPIHTHFRNLAQYHWQERETRDTNRDSWTGQ